MRSLGFLLFFSVFCGVLFISCDSLSHQEVLALNAFKKAIYDDPRLVLLDWNTVVQDPCDWVGIYCSPARDHVITLNLSSSSLQGFIAPELGYLISLQKLVLHKNNLIGTIPSEIGLLNNLTLLDLSMNQLSGPIPNELGYLNKVKQIYLQSNGLTGIVPAELGNLTNLVELKLDRNKLQGALPGNNTSMNFGSGTNGMYVPLQNATGFCRSPQLKIADFSYNFFVGKIPQCLKYLPRSSFRGNCFKDSDSNMQRTAKQCGGASPVKSHQAPTQEYSHTKDVHSHLGSSRPTWLLALEITTGIVVGFLLLLAIFAAVKRCKAKSQLIIPSKKTANGKDHIAISVDAELLKDVLRISRQDLEVTCEDFSNIIGTSPDSLVYKGTMKDGREIAVISLCILEEHWTGYLELYFQNEVADLARLNHENTGKLIGYCKESIPFSRMLVFEYASNGTLYEHLHYGEGGQLSWIRRMKIIIGIARGLKYLHTELHPPFTLSELNSSTIYLTEDFSPKLVDFERWKTVLAKSEKNPSFMNNAVAIRGFLDSLERRNVDVQGNKFAFGVLLLEIISGRPPYCKDRGCLVNWAKEYLELPEMLSYLVDPELKYFKYDDLRVICEVVNNCFQLDLSKRPSMESLGSMLEKGIDTSTAVDLKESPLAWAELVISS
ncbi:putative LRR receptor-like serine/threonine-protein kinase At1g63430 isoform X2 [Tasmannia lanceolata]|uniref:putative LRR receptor-like serine/threonine-protein kinase At1g63430 isoform X2 n=1 Tax=Tasmannia lanceolata TaxID=3420 RepID=UPI0040643514